MRAPPPPRMTSCDFTLFYSFLTQANVIFLMCLVRSIIANLSPIMIHFDALDFNVCRSEEVISFFWRSVYVYHDFYLSTSKNYSSRNKNLFTLALLMWKSRYYSHYQLLNISDFFFLVQWAFSNNVIVIIGYFVASVHLMQFLFILTWWRYKRQLPYVPEKNYNRTFRINNFQSIE